MRNKALTDLEFGRMNSNPALDGLNFGSMNNNPALGQLQFNNMRENKIVSGLNFNTGNVISQPKKESEIKFKKVIKLRNGKLGMFFVFTSGEKLILPFDEVK